MYKKMEVKINHFRFHWWTANAMENDGLPIIVLCSVFLPGVTSSVKMKVIDNSGTEKDFDLCFFISDIYMSTFKLAEKIRGQFSSEVPL